MSGEINKTCTKCCEEYPLDTFHKKGNGNRRRDCPTCVREYGKLYREVNKERIREKKKEYRIKHPEVKRESYLKLTYGISILEYEEMLAKQGGVCIICKASEVRNIQHKHMHVDHCHTVGHIRGILCSRCNAGLGQFDDRPELLMAAAGYLLYDKRTKGA